MQIRSTTSVKNTSPVQFKTQAKTDNISTSSNGLPADQLEISIEARALNSNTGIRFEKVAELRQQIATGRYETADKINLAVDRILDEIA